MPVDFKDYYATLGVARDATADEIKKAFRALARKHHPDLAKDKKAGEAKFKEINEANEVLGDPARRRKYDELGASWQEEPRRQSASRPGEPWAQAARGRPGREFHFTGTGFSDFFEAYFGGGRRFGFESDEDFPGESDRAQGRHGADIEGEILVTLAEVMHGTVRPISLRIVDPRTGQVETRSFHVRIPAGATEGRRIRVPGKGEPGGADAPDGDLYLRVRFATHPDFRVQDGDLFHDVDLAPWEAVLGTTITAPSFEGPIRVRIAPGTQHGAQLRVRGHGLPRGRSAERGDLFVVAQIQLPSRLSGKEKALWEELRTASTFSPREHA